MDLSENIQNAFDIVKITHENINKLMKYCKTISEEKGKYVLVSPKHLRWRNNNPQSWCISSFILLFQNMGDEIFENNGWHKGPIYVLEINLYEPEFYDVPMASIAKYEYADIASWDKGVSSTDQWHWRIYDPFYSNDLMNMTMDGDIYDCYVKDKQLADSKWWGLRRIVGFSLPLTDITPDNAYDTIFGGFDSLADR